MNRRDAIFLLCVLIFALFFAAATISKLGEIPSGGAHATFGKGGKARDLNMEVIEKQIEDGRLSDHEALFYKAAPDNK